MGNPIPTLILASVAATLEVCGLVIVGVIFRASGILDKMTTQRVSKMLFLCITPCFLGFKVFQAISFELLLSTWIVPLFAVFCIGLSFVLGNLLFGCLLRVKGLKKRLAIVACCFGNFSTIPLLFLSALARTGIFHGEKDENVMKVLSFVSMFLPPNTILIFSLGFLYMSTRIAPNDPCLMYHLEEDNEGNNDSFKVLKEILGETQDGVGDGTEVFQESNDEPADVDDIRENDLDDIRENDDMRENEGMRENDKTNHNLDDIREMDENDLLIDEENDFAPARKNYVKKGAKFIFQRILTPPIIGIFIGGAVGLIPGVKVLAKDPPIIIGNVLSVIENLGNVFFGMAMIILGSNLTSAAQSKPKRKSNHKNSIIRFFRTYIIKFNDFKTIIGVIVLKLIIMPIVSLGIVNALVWFGIVSRHEPILIMTLLLEGSTPCALTLGILCNLNNDVGVDEISELTIVEYLVSPITIIFWSTIFLFISCQWSGDCNL